MRRVNADGVIARVADLQALRYRSYEKAVGEAVRADMPRAPWLSSVRSVPDASVLMRRLSPAATEPRPTFILSAPFYLRPESLGRGEASPPLSTERIAAPLESSIVGLAVSERDMGFLATDDRARPTHWSKSTVE